MGKNNVVEVMEKSGILWEMEFLEETAVLFSNDGLIRIHGVLVHWRFIDALSPLYPSFHEA